MKIIIIIYHHMITLYFIYINETFNTISQKHCFDLICDSASKINVSVCIVCLCVYRYTHA